jgi:hypothetical protein
MMVANIETGLQRSHVARCRILRTIIWHLSLWKWSWLRRRANVSEYGGCELKGVRHVTRFRSRNHSRTARMAAS